MDLLALLYILASVTSILAGLPQIVQILRTKNVEGINLQTYDMWAVLQAAGLPYTVQSGNALWFGVSIGWLIYYVAVIILIEHYRYPHYISVILSHVASFLKLLPVHSH